MIEVKVGINQCDQRLDRFLRKEFSTVSLNRIFKVLRKKKVRINGKRGLAEQMLVEGDVVCIYEDFPELAEQQELENKFLQQDVEKHIRVVHEDESLLVLNKCDGIAVHSGSDQEISLIELVWQYLNWKESGAFKPSLVHRLDKGTSGIILVAKTAKALRLWNERMKHRSLKKYYMAVVSGCPEEEEGVIRLRLERRNSQEGGAKIAVVEDGIFSETHYEVIEKRGGYSLVRLLLGTGRMHQIRTHLAHIGCPILGDDRYGEYEVNKTFKKDFGVRRMLLHSCELKSSDGDFAADWRSEFPEKLGF